jgi:hypothetical protein
LLNVFVRLVKQTLLLGARDNVSCTLDVALAMLFDQPPHLRGVRQSDGARNTKREDGNESRIMLTLDMLREVGTDISVI